MHICSKLALKYSIRGTCCCRLAITEVRMKYSYNMNDVDIMSSSQACIIYI